MPRELWEYKENSTATESEEVESRMKATQWRRYPKGSWKQSRHLGKKRESGEGWVLQAERMTSAEGTEAQNGIVNLGYTTQFNIPHHKYQGVTEGES